MRDPETDQQLPEKNSHPYVQDLVLADIEARKAIGLKKYGTLLQPENGRDFKQDVYEELLDACIYMRGLIEEDRLREARAAEHEEKFAQPELFSTNIGTSECACVDPQPISVGYIKHVCQVCRCLVPDSKLAHLQ